MKPIVRPTLIVDEKVCRENIKRMADKARDLGIRFRPHFKTHQSLKVGEWFKEAGVDCITVSSVQMAEYFANAGWSDITIAFPLNILEIESIRKLSERISLQVVIENTEAIEVLQNNPLINVGTWIKVDTGYNRTGIEATDFEMMDKVITAVVNVPTISFKGFLTHTGQTYQANSLDEIMRRHFDSLMKLKNLRSRYSGFFPKIEISMGDTPSASVCTYFNGVNELRPGNFVFYDLMQQNLGVCRFENIAVKMVCPVVALHPSRNEVVIHGGAVHFSKDFILNTDGKKMFGRIIIEKEGGKKLLDTLNYLSGLSQEHGILKIAQAQLQHFYVGQLIEILPVHSCLTANLMGYYYTTSGELIPMMPKF